MKCKINKKLLFLMVSFLIPSCVDYGYHPEMLSDSCFVDTQPYIHETNGCYYEEKLRSYSGYVEVLCCEWYITKPYHECYVTYCFYKDECRWGYDYEECYLN